MEVPRSKDVHQTLRALRMQTELPLFIAKSKPGAPKEQSASDPRLSSGEEVSS